MIELQEVILIHETLIEQFGVRKVSEILICCFQLLIDHLEV
jgi:hypothetical protein